MWIMIWLLITVFIVVVSGWSFSILMQQKKAWKAFAEKHKFTYSANKLMESPHMRGRFDNLIINMYSDRQATEDMRGFRYVSVVEIELGSGIPVKAAIGTEKTKALVNELSLAKDITLEHEKWVKDYIARTDNKRRFRSYFNEKRIETLMGLFAMKKTTVLFFCDELDAVLRIETSDPMRNADKMERIMKRLVRDMKVLAPNASEAASVPNLQRVAGVDEEDDEAAENKDVPPVLAQDVDLDDIDLELEDDEDVAEAAAAAMAVTAAQAEDNKSEDKKPAAKKKAPAKKATTKKTTAKKKPATKKAAAKKSTAKADDKKNG